MAKMFDKIFFGGVIGGIVAWLGYALITTDSIWTRIGASVFIGVAVAFGFLIFSYLGSLD